MRFQDPSLEKKGGQWRIRVRVPVVQPDGSVVRKQKPFHLGKISEISRTEAARRKQELLASINAGPIVFAGQIRFGEVLAKYKSSKIPLLAESTKGKYLSHIDRHIEPAFRDLKIAEIDTPAIQAWLNTKTTLSWATKTDLRNILSAIFTAADEWKIVSANPVAKVKVGRRRAVYERDRIPVDKLPLFLAAIPDTKIIPAQGARLIASIAILNGARVSEVLGLQWRDIEGEYAAMRRGWVRGHESPGKSDGARRQFYLKPLEEELRLWARRQGQRVWIFERSECQEPPDDRDLQQHVFRPAAEAVKIYRKGFGLHDFRRLNISMRQDFGASPMEAAKAAGHVSPSTTWIYTLPDEARSKDQVEKIAGVLFGGGTSL